MRAALWPAVLAHLRELAERGEISSRQQRVLDELEQRTAPREPDSADMADTFEALFARVDAGLGDELEQQRAAVARSLWDRIRARHAAELAGDSSGYAWQFRDVDGHSFWG
ncbi:MAG TPA: hypothetical protein VMS54_13320, partial [Vicinamibacterales bacterium]|nr:hypothetical protein [Vicinamibacterales bacterium]